MKTAKFEYKEGHEFKIHHTDGAFVSTNPKGSITMRFYSEHVTPPKDIEYNVLKDGKIGTPIKKEIDRSFTRIFDTGIIIDLNTMVAIRDLLDRIIDEHPNNIKK